MINLRSFYTKQYYQKWESTYTSQKYTVTDQISAQGLACPNIYTEQGIAQLQLLLDHGGLQTQCVILVLTCYESSTLETGSAYPMFDIPYAKYQDLATQSYLKSICEFIEKNNSMY